VLKVRVRWWPLVLLGVMGCGAPPTSTAPASGLSSDPTSLSISPAIVVDGESFVVSWNPVDGAASYRLQLADPTGFPSVEWERTAAGTTLTLALSPGAHRLRVAPVVFGQTGRWSAESVGYTLGGSRVTVVNELTPRAVDAGDGATIRGENLDFPGTRVLLGDRVCELLSVRYDQLVFRIPPDAHTADVFVYSPLDGGATFVGAPLVIRRIAYIVSDSSAAGVMPDYLAYYSADIAASGVAIVPTNGLGSRDLHGFDLIVVGADTGTDADDWAGGVEGRFDTLVNARIPVLAIGLGGAAFLARAGAVDGESVERSVSAWVYADHPIHSVFELPHPVLPPGEDALRVSSIPEGVITLMAAAPGSGLRALGLARVDADSSRWVAADIPPGYGRLQARAVFWGVSAPPDLLTGQGADWLSNVVAALYPAR